MKRIIVTALLVMGAPASAQTAFDGDTPVEKIAANPDAAAVVNKDIPGLLSDSQYPLFKSMSLKQLQEASGGELSSDTVDKTVTDLQALTPAAGAPAPAPNPPPPPVDAPAAPAPTDQATPPATPAPAPDAAAPAPTDQATSPSPATSPATPAPAPDAAAPPAPQAAPAPAPN